MNLFLPMSLRLPQTPVEWLAEIMQAMDEACSSLRGTEESRCEPAEEMLYQMAPLLALRARGRPEQGPEAEWVIEAALPNVPEIPDSDESNAPLTGDPHLAFALGYLSTHVALGLIDEDHAAAVLDKLAGTLLGD
jgi:hypothetical protein